MLKRTKLNGRVLNYMYYNMINRCYNHKQYPKYKGCKVCDLWLNDKESFKNWVIENHYIIDDEQIDLDKDILVKGNKVYSPETCVFAPHIINTCFENLTRKPTKTKKGKYRIDLCVEGKTNGLGVFDTEEEAKREYIKHKEAAILYLADKYKDNIPMKLYETMTNYKLDLSDWK